MDNSEFKVFEKDLLFKNSPSNERILCMYIKRNKCFTNLFKNAFFCNLKRSLLKAPFLYLLLEKKKKKKSINVRCLFSATKNPPSFRYKMIYQAKIASYYAFYIMQNNYISIAPPQKKRRYDWFKIERLFGSHFFKPYTS